MTVIPDSIEPIIGYKALAVFETGWGELRLFSPQQRSCDWQPGRKMEARCPRQWDHHWVPMHGMPNPRPEEDVTVFQSGYISTTTNVSFQGDKPEIILPLGLSWSWEPIEHEVASKDCVCGIHVVDHPENTDGYFEKGTVLVQVALWGRVSIGERGARGQFAYPQKIIASKCSAKITDQVAQAYKIPNETPQKLVKKSEVKKRRIGLVALFPIIQYVPLFIAVSVLSLIIHNWLF